MDKNNAKLLLVDDDLLILDLYEKAFRIMGYRIDTANDGQDAVDKLEKMGELPVLILLDIIMPKMSGFDVLQYLKQSYKLKNIPVVMLTSMSDQEARDKAKALGVVDYIVKTDLDPKQIVEKIGQIIEKSSGN